jgi:PKHD-type hydroxylase
MSHLPLWYLGKVEPEICDKVIAELSKQPERDATMGVNGEETNNQQRNTSIVFASQDFWFSQTMEQFAHEANKVCCWDYLIDSREAIQFAKYGVNQHYGWHVDTFPLSGQLTDRKVSVVCLLNDPSEFEGGQFQARLYQEYTVPLEKGSMIAFPSSIEHRVIPVTSGFRYSATMWLHGPRFR